MELRCADFPVRMYYVCANSGDSQTLPVRTVICIKCPQKFCMVHERHLNLSDTLKVISRHVRHLERYFVSVLRIEC